MRLMWPFRRKKVIPAAGSPAPACPYCRSSNARLIVCHGTDQPNYVKIWRGRRSLTFRCPDCGRDFYVDEPPEGMIEEMLADSSPVDDEDALRAAEEAVRKQAGEEKDRRRWY